VSSPTDDQRSAFLGAAGLVGLFAAGVALATSWFVSYPGPVLAAAWLVAVAAMAAVIVYAFRESRASGTGFFTAVGHSFKALGQFIVWFF